MNNKIKKILVSEKSFQMVASGKYTFIVDKTMTKNEVAKNCESLFGVNVLSVNSMNYKGKVKMQKRKAGKRNDFKKVILSVKPGQKIDLFEIEKEQQESPKKRKKAKEKKTVENKDVEVKIKSK